MNPSFPLPEDASVVDELNHYIHDACRYERDDNNRRRILQLRASIADGSIEQIPNAVRRLVLDHIKSTGFAWRCSMYASMSGLSADLAADLGRGQPAHPVGMQHDGSLCNQRWRMLMKWGADPSLNWPSRFRLGDVVRLDDGRIALVVMVLDYSPVGSPAKYELLLRHRPPTGLPDEDIFEPWMATPAPDAQSRQEARAQGLLEGLDD